MTTSLFSLEPGLTTVPPRAGRVVSSRATPSELLFRLLLMIDISACSYFFFFAWGVSAGVSTSEASSSATTSSGFINFY